MDLLVQYALTFIGTPYRWGGDDPMGGFDCSGWLQEILASVGEDPPGDQTAQALYDHFIKAGFVQKHPSPGALAFYGRNYISHVGFCIDSTRMIEAGGGGSNTHTLEDAEKHNAYVRMRPVRARSDLKAIILPRYGLLAGKQ